MIARERIGTLLLFESKLFTYSGKEELAQIHLSASVIDFIKSI